GGARLWSVPKMDELVAEVLADPRILAAAVRQPEKSSSAWERDAAKYGKELKRLVREEVQLIRDKDKHSRAAYDIALGELRREQEQCEQRRKEAEERVKNAAVVADALDQILAMRWALVGVVPSSLQRTAAAAGGACAPGARIRRLAAARWQREGARSTRPSARRCAGTE